MCGRCHGLTHAETVTGPDDDPGWLRFQNDDALTKPVLYRERREAELRDLPRPPHERRDFVHAQ